MLKQTAGIVMAFLTIAAAGIPMAEAGYVRGYSKKDGTYVSPYYRSRPNAYKYDNYNYSGGDLYNDSYLSPRRSYSPSWYTSSFSDPGYFDGLSYNRNFQSWSPSLFDYTSPSFPSGSSFRSLSLFDPVYPSLFDY